MTELKFSNYGQERTINATDEEMQIFDVIRSMVPDPKRFRMVRKSDNYVSAVYGSWDLARFKFTQRAKWVMFPVLEKSKDRHQIESPTDVNKLADWVENSLAHIAKYSKRPTTPKKK